jgi:hypothetical protein
MEFCLFAEFEDIRTIHIHLGFKYIYNEIIFIKGHVSVTDGYLEKVIAIMNLSLHKQ